MAQQDKGIAFRNNPDAPSGPRGHNYLLAIAIDEYQHCSPLNNAVHDVEVFIALMKHRYNFEEQNVTLIKNTEATKKRIEQELIRLTKKVTGQDCLIVYFSGHGRFDPHLGGNWVPVDAGATDDDWPDYLSNDLVKSYLNRIDSFHTFLIADSCFSGSLFIDKSKDRFTGDRRETEPSRWGLTSGKREIVSDGDPGYHSPFATALLDVLSKADQPPGVMRLCDLVLEKVAANALQTPMGSPLAIQGHQGGQFVFHFRADENADWKDMQDTPEGCRRYLVLYPEGKYRIQAEAVLAKQAEDQAWQAAVAARSVGALVSFETQFPQSLHVTTGEMDTHIADLEEDELWRETTRSNSVAAYRDYLRRTRLGKYRLEAGDAQKVLLQWEEEPTAWQQAVLQASKMAYEAYIQQFPQGAHLDEAKAALRKIRQDEVLKEQETRAVKAQQEQHRHDPDEAERKKRGEEARPQANPLPWRRYAMIAGGILAVVWLIWILVKPATGVDMPAMEVFQSNGEYGYPRRQRQHFDFPAIRSCRTLPERAGQGD